MRRTLLAFFLLSAVSFYGAEADDQAARRAGLLAEWQALAERGDADTALRLGNLYATGDGVPADDRLAARWYRVAADLGQPRAQLALGLLYATGQGVPRDLRQAHMWVNLAAISSVAGSWEARDRLVDLMTPEEIAGAVRMALDWEPNTVAVKAPQARVQPRP